MDTEAIIDWIDERIAARKADKPVPPATLREAQERLGQ